MHFDSTATINSIQEPTERRMRTPDLGADIGWEHASIERGHEANHHDVLVHRGPPALPAATAATSEHKQSNQNKAAEQNELANAIFTLCRQRRWDPLPAPACIRADEHSEPNFNRTSRKQQRQVVGGGRCPIAIVSEWRNPRKDCPANHCRTVRQFKSQENQGKATTAYFAISAK